MSERRREDISDILREFEYSKSVDEAGIGKSKSSGSWKEGTIYQQLVATMVNERMAPELLPYQYELVDEVLKRVSNQQMFLLDSHEYGDSNMESGLISNDFKLQLMIIETDLERVNYLVRLYLRTRLAKIDKHAIYYINKLLNEDTSVQPSFMSDKERDYAHQHFKIMTQLYNNCFLKKFPKFLMLLDDTSGGQSMIEEPDVNRHVFIKVITKEPIVISVGIDEELELVEGGVYVVKYFLVKRYIEMGDIVLI